MAKELKGAGNTPGGVGEFFAGMLLSSGGAYLLTNNVTVHSNSWQFMGYSAFGMSLFPLMFGCALLFFSGKSMLGWLRTVCGAG